AGAERHRQRGQPVAELGDLREQGVSVLPAHEEIDVLRRPNHPVNRQRKAPAEGIRNSRLFERASDSVQLLNEIERTGGHGDYGSELMATRKTRLRYYPIELDLEGREALFVGALDDEARRRIDRLRRAGAPVTVRDHAEAGDAGGKAIVSVTPEHEARGRVLRDEGALVCTVDRPEASTFANPAVVVTDAITMTIGGGEASPGIL